MTTASSAVTLSAPLDLLLTRTAYRAASQPLSLGTTAPLAQRWHVPLDWAYNERVRLTASNLVQPRAPSNCGLSRRRHRFLMAAEARRTT